MEAVKILNADLLDIVFDNRNKEYGAYELRRTYGTRITKALLVTGLVVTGLIGISMMKPAKEPMTAMTEPDAVIIKTQIIPEEIKPVIPEPVQASAPKPPVQSERVTEIIIVKDNVKVDPIATQADVQIAAIDVKAASGGEPDNVPGPIEGPPSKGIIAAPEPPSDVPLREVDEHAKFNGDWTKFLRRNLRAEVPVDNEAPTGRYTVLVEFVVDVDGSVSQVTALTAHGYGLEQEAVRVIKKSDKWTPSFWKGRPVKAYHKQQITFEVVGSD